MKKILIVVASIFMGVSSFVSCANSTSDDAAQQYMMQQMIIANMPDTKLVGTWYKTNVKNYHVSFYKTNMECVIYENYVSYRGKWSCVKDAMGVVTLTYSGFSEDRFNGVYTILFTADGFDAKQSDGKTVSYSKKVPTGNNSSSDETPEESLAEMPVNNPSMKCDEDGLYIHNDPNGVSVETRYVKSSSGSTYAALGYGTAIKRKALESFEVIDGKVLSEYSFLGLDFWENCYSGFFPEIASSDKNLYYFFDYVSGKEYKGFKYTSSINKNGKYRVIIKYKCVDDDTNYYGTVFYDLKAEKVTE